jgi:DNA ligase-1
MQRRRKHDIESYVGKIPIRYMIFDMLSLDSRSLLQEPLKKRKEMIKKNFKPGPQIEPVEGLLTSELAEEEEFFNNAVEHGAEGIMIKDAASPYKAGARGWQWIKFKKDYQEGLADSFDLVVVGALHGSGRRGGTYGSLLAASYDPETGKYYSFTKVGAGLTDENLAGLYKKLNKYKIKNKHRLLEIGMEADVWFEPVVVLEVAGAEITVSPVHTVAKDKIKKGGLALRFPRFLRWRDDKKPTQATNVKEIYEIYKKT